jgi:methylated-DNA-[protein]-cysteine S-methyltransferase
MDTILYREFFESPAGWMEITASRSAVQSVLFRGQVKPESLQPNPVTNTCIDELRGYFKGLVKQFTVPFEMKGTPFQTDVWKEVSKVPYGKLASYNSLAAALQKALAVRAVGMANGKNRILILIPCHRVVGSDGSLVGYAGELWRKKWLLELEARYSGHGQMAFEF